MSYQRSLLAVTFLLGSSSACFSIERQSDTIRNLETLHCAHSPAELTLACFVFSFSGSRFSLFPGAQLQLDGDSSTRLISAHGNAALLLLQWCGVLLETVLFCSSYASVWMSLSVRPPCKLVYLFAPRPFCAVSSSCLLSHPSVSSFELGYRLLMRRLKLREGTADRVEIRGKGLVE